MKLFLVPLEESWDQLFSALVIVQISHKPKISMERLGLLVVQGIEKVNSVLVGLVREISVQALLHQVAHLHASNIGSVTLQEMNDIVLNGKLLGVLLKQHWQKRVGSTLLIVLRIHVESSFSHVPGGSIGWHDVVAKNSEQIVLQVFQFLLANPVVGSRSHNKLDQCDLGAHFLGPKNTRLQMIREIFVFTDGNLFES